MPTPNLLPFCRQRGKMLGLFQKPVRGETAPLEPSMAVLVQPGVDKPAMLIVACTNVITATGHEKLARPLPRLVQR